jgi:hypothetical protein
MMISEMRCNAAGTGLALALPARLAAQAAAAINNKRRRSIVDVVIASDSQSFAGDLVDAP